MGWNCDHHYAKPHPYKIPNWFLNRKNDVKEGKYSHFLTSGLHKLHEDLEQLKKLQAHRGLHHFWGLHVQGQHTNVQEEINL